MIMRTNHRLAIAVSALSTLLLAASAQAQIVGYGINSAGTLFRFDPAAPAVVTNIGPTGLSSTAIDFRPGTNTLYSLVVGANTSTLFTVDINTAVATAVGTGFPTANIGYDLGGNNRVGFDFNPTTLQGDNSMRIRVISDNSRSNLRLNSSTGAIAGVDTLLSYVGSPDAPFADGSAYVNNFPNQATIPTTLYTMDGRNDALYVQNPPNSGTLNLVGIFGIDANPGIAFDIVSLNPADNTLADERAFAVLQNTATGSGVYLLYDVSLTTGAISNARQVGGLGGPDFVGGLALINIPEPTTVALVAGAGALLLRRQRRA